MSDTATENIGTAFTKKIGPLPGWVWVLIVVAGAYGVYYWRKRNGGTTSAPAVTYTDPNTTGFSSAPAATVGQNQATPVSTVTDYASWSMKAAGTLTAQGKYAISDISNAFTKYGNGQALNPTESAIVNDAITQNGYPPSGILAVNKGFDPTGFNQLYQALLGRNPNATEYSNIQNQNLSAATVQGYITNSAEYKDKHGGSASPVHLYTTQTGDTLASISSLFYGNSTSASKIASANKNTLINPANIPAGTVIVIPA